MSGWQFTYHYHPWSEEEGISKSDFEAPVTNITERKRDSSDLLQVKNIQLASILANTHNMK